MLNLIKVLTTLAAFALSPARAQVCAHRIYFLPQSHAPNGIANADLTPSDRLEVAQSQLQIANFLDRFPQLDVFSEQATTEDMSVDQLDAETIIKLKQMMNTTFPRGLNIDPKTLNAEQIQKLVDNGGETIQMMRGRLETIHRVLQDQATDDRIFKPVLNFFATHPKGSAYPPHIARAIYGEREREALNQIRSFLAAHPERRDVALLFGKHHNFSFYRDLFPPECIVVPPEFRAEWTGQYRVGPEGFSPEVMRTGVLPTGPGAAR